MQELPYSEPEIPPRSQGQRNPWAVIDLFVFGLFFFVLLLLIAPFAGLEIIYAIPLQGAFNLALVAFIAAWVRIVRRKSFKEYVHFFREGHRIFPLVALGVALALSVTAASQFLPSAEETPIAKLLNSTTAILVFGIFGVAVAPLLEEIIFRGFIFKALWEAAGARVAVLFTAALFALVHAGQLAGNWGGVLLIFAVGSVLSIIRQRTNSIIPGFVVHTAYNSTLFVLFALSSLMQKLVR
jgi:membrane protease YdiL (CAAX protease family)